MQIHTHNNRRIIQHTDNHYDIEEYKPVLNELGEPFGYVWAVIYCSEDEMARTINGNLTGKAAQLDKADNNFDLPLTDLEKVEIKGRVARKMQENMVKNGFTAEAEKFKTEAEGWEKIYILLRDGQKNADSVHNLIVTAESTEGKFTDGFSDPRTDAEKSADAEWQDEQATRADLHTGFQQW